MKKLSSELKLPNGTRIKNRIAKSAMNENLSDKDHSPTKLLPQLYQRWGRSGAGLLITGNVMVDSRAIGEPRNVVVEDRRDFELLKQWATSVNGTEIHIWPQINHPGRQALEQINENLVGPSAVPVKMAGRKSASKKIPRALTEDEIWEIIHRYARTASILKDAGFTGVQIHGAHGYLVSQFLSPYTNVRTDQWGGNAKNRARFVLEVYKAIRKSVGADFPIGIKLNSADFQRGGFTEESSLEVVQMLSEVGIDLIEISGGTFENPTMVTGTAKQSSVQREAFFFDYIEKARKITQTPLMLTGGFRTVKAMEQAVEDDVLDVVGIARPFAVFPDLPNDIFSGKKAEFQWKRPNTGIKAIDGMMELMWYESQIKRIGEGKEPNMNLSAWSAFFRYFGLTMQQALTKKQRS